MRSIVPQGHDRIDASGPAGGVDPRDQTDEDGEDDSPGQSHQGKIEVAHARGFYSR